MIKRDLTLHRLNTESQSRVQTAVTKLSSHLFNYMGHIGAGIIIGGLDVKGPQMWGVDPHGHTICMPFQTQGSGSLAANAILENEWVDDMTEEQAVDLASRSIEAGIYHDLGSGSNVDYVVINKDGANMVRSHKHDNHKLFDKPGGYPFPNGTTEVLEVTHIPLNIEEGHAPMDL
jgi:20S proteasome subunit beta 2